jgi:hypothetical protein
MRRIVCLLVVVATTVVATSQESKAGGWDYLTRWFEGGSYESKCDNCAMPWQPIQSTMHYNVLPPGMHRPIGLRRPLPSLSPRTPSFAGQPKDWKGCANGCSTDR